MGFKSREQALEYYKQYNAKRRQKKEPSARQKAIAAGESHYDTGKPCIRGHYSLRNVNTRKCMECDRQDKKTLQINCADKVKARKRNEYAKNRNARLAQKKQYRQANKGRINALSALRKKIVIQRTPKWINEDYKWMLRQAYELAALRTSMFGFSWHVDHIVPLQGKTVSGLHVPWNLQVIPAIDNIRKRNRWDHA